MKLPGNCKNPLDSMLHYLVFNYAMQRRWSDAWVCFVCILRRSVLSCIATAGAFPRNYEPFGGIEEVPGTLIYPPKKSLLLRWKRSYSFYKDWHWSLNKVGYLSKWKVHTVVTVQAVSGVYQESYWWTTLLGICIGPCWYAMCLWSAWLPGVIRLSSCPSQMKYWGCD